MNQGDFAQDPAVQAFLEWTQTEHWRERLRPVGKVSLPADSVEPHLPRLPGLAVRLDIRSSRFVPTPICGVANFCEIPWLYMWKAAGMQVGDLDDALTWLAGFSAGLNGALAAGNVQGALSACDDILRWGGERNRSHGARPILEGLGSKLPTYLQQCRQALSLAHATVDEQGDLAGVPYMNSMLSKVYSVLCADGLPIYDSRVAAAIATLVETWRIQQGLDHTPIPMAMRFPAIPPNQARRVQARYQGAADPGVLLYGHPDTPKRWAGAAVRLGWLLQLMSGFYASPTVSRIIESSLFMAGYDCQGINYCPTPGQQVPRNTLRMMFAQDADDVLAKISRMPGHPWNRQDLRDGL